MFSENYWKRNYRTAIVNCCAVFWNLIHIAAKAEFPVQFEGRHFVPNLVHAPVGYRRMLPFPGRQSGGNSKEVQRHHQDGSQPAQRHPVCTVWR